ncbi:MAG: DUF4234 domain-containing protein [Lachnospiraceae bacterium]|nr:DUF4234 domain-containing protein [Lachnospiraceae bacterium]
MKYCTQCGSQCEDNAKFCTQCGSPLTQDTRSDQTENSYGAQDGYQSSYNSSYNNAAYSSGIQPRNIVVAVILSFVTCGIYDIYWMIKLNDEVNLLSGETNATSGGMVFLFSLLTCGIYGIYWLYKMGERCDRIKGENGNSAILYLILSIVGLSIVSYCLIQDTLNKAVS